MSYMIDIDRLSKCYRKGRGNDGVLAVDSLSLQVMAGEAFGFIGQNGAGKSSTIKMLTGGVMPTSGTAKLAGVDVRNPESRCGVGYAPEVPSLYDYLTPLEILRMGISLHRVRIQNLEKHCMEWLERFDIAAIANKKIRSFSKGMMQRVTLAQAMAINPKLLILDEPLSGLDPVGRKEVVDILAEYKRSGGTLFFTSHVLHDVERLADRFGLIHRGCLRAVRSPAELAGEEESLEIRSMGAKGLPGMRNEFSGRWSASVKRTEIWGYLECLRAEGHQILEIRPTLSLETAFLAALQKNEKNVT